MKRVVSVSLGSSRRNHAARVRVLGEEVLVERIGTDGDLEKAIALIRELDGRVDAFGMGGIDLYVYAGGRRYAFRDARRIAAAARRSAIVDGSGLKNTLERRVVQYIDRQGIFPLQGKRVLMVASVDRFGMAEALVQAGADVCFGDLMFALGLPVPLRSLRAVALLGRLLLPIIVNLPFQLLYPTGKQQEENRPRFRRWFAWADLIAGDAHYIRRYMSEDLSGKAILTNTVTAEDVAEFRRRGVRLLVTTTPELEGRSFGTNVMEGLLVALAGKRPEEMTPADYEAWLDRLGVGPRVEWLQESR